MHTRTIEKTRILDLCVSCEICAAACKHNAITMEYTCGLFLPVINPELCKGCSLCLQICPGIDIDPHNEIGHEYEKQRSSDIILNCYTAFSKNFRIRENSTSGGMITTLIKELIESKEYDEAYVLNFDHFSNQPARVIATSDPDTIIHSAKSKYVPSSMYNLIQDLIKGKRSKIIVIGTPCQICGVKKFLHKLKISEENILFLGLFCARTMNFNFIRYCEKKYLKKTEIIDQFDFRIKDRDGWPGNVGIITENGKRLTINKKIRGNLTRFFQLYRCHFCYDKLNKSSDISFGDCYLPQHYSFYGKSSVIVRTKKGQQIISDYASLFTLIDSDYDEIKQSQGINSNYNKLNYAKLLFNELEKKSKDPHQYQNDGIILHNRKLKNAIRYSKLGKQYHPRKIDIYMIIPKIKILLEEIAIYAFKGFVLSGTLIKDFFIPAYHSQNDRFKIPEKGNILIIGGGFHNKGAQAMTFHTVDQLKQKMPDKEFYLAHTPEYEMYEKENPFKMNFLPWDMMIKTALLWNMPHFIKNKFIKNKKILEHANIYRDKLDNTGFIVDISGYAISSQFGFGTSIDYLTNIMIAKKFGIPYYILPQSIGPFDYRFYQKLLLWPFLKIYLKYPEKIFVRESEGMDTIIPYTQNNVIKEYDMILRSKEYNTKNIVKYRFKVKDIEIQNKSVGIIPNVNVMKRSCENEIYNIYRIIIQECLNKNKIIYILQHSFEDQQLCENIKNMFINDKNVILLQDELNFLELECVLKKFEFVVASRYHSVIHAYKNGTPAFVIGWATKYIELLQIFDQQQYYVDSRNINADDTALKEIISKIILQNNLEREMITQKITKINEKNFFDLYFSTLQEN